MREPPHGTVERWAWDYVLADSLAAKLAPPAVPDEMGAGVRARSSSRRAGSPPQLRVVSKAGKTRGLAAPSGRTRALRTFFHHALQAAELMAWAVLAFPETPREFRAGLVRIEFDEIRHMHLYAEQMTRLGFEIGQFTVRDWFWERVPRCADAIAFVATMGLGVESASLEHTASFAAPFREAGDEEGARIQECVSKS